MVAKAGSHLLAATALAVLAGACLGAGSARAQDATCLASPNGPAPAGTHWYYKTDQATHQKCWYTRGQEQAAQAAPAETTPSRPAPSRTPVAQAEPANPDADATQAPEESAAPVGLAPAPPRIHEHPAPLAAAAPRRAVPPIARVPVPAADPRGENQPITTATAPRRPQPACRPPQTTSPGRPHHPCRRPRAQRDRLSHRRLMWAPNLTHRALRWPRRHRVRPVRQLPRRIAAPTRPQA